MAMHQALNAARMKERNYARLFRELRIQPMTRSELARSMGLTRAATSLIADHLLSTGILLECPAKTGSGRVTAKALRWNESFYHVLGIHLGRDVATVGLTDFCGRVLGSVRFSCGECGTGQEVLERACRSLEELVTLHKPSGALLGVGVAAPGPLDTGRGVILNPPSFPLMHNVEVARCLEERLGCQVTLENDANALVLAEKCFGLRDRYRRFLELVVDTGVGASLILEGRLQKGPSGLGNGFGHTSINLEGPRCSCGNNGCVELYASIPQIVKAARERDASLSSWQTVVDRAYGGDSTALKIVDKEARYLAALVVNASNVLDLQAVVLAGDSVLYRPELLLEAISREVEHRISFDAGRVVEVLPSRILQNPRALSAANLAVEGYLEQPGLMAGWNGK